MADLSQSSAQNHISNTLSFCDRLSPTDPVISAAEKRQICTDMIHRLETLVAVQQDRVNAMRHWSVGGRSQTRRLRALMRDNLLTYKGTLQQVRQTAQTLEVSWALWD